MSRMTAEEMAEAERLDAARTQGEWRHGQWQYEMRDGRNVYTEIAARDHEDISIAVDVAIEAAQNPGNQRYVVSGCGCCGSPSGSADDATFIARCSTLVPSLLAEVRALTEERDVARAAISSIGRQLIRDIAAVMPLAVVPAAGEAMARLSELEAALDTERAEVGRLTKLAVDLAGERDHAVQRAEQLRGEVKAAKEQLVTQQMPGMTP